MKFHVNLDTGNVGRCNASVRECPYGGENVHFESEAEARRSFEKVQATALPAKRSKRHKKPSVLDYDQSVVRSVASVKTEDDQKEFVRNFLASDKVRNLTRHRSGEIRAEKLERIEKLKETEEGRAKLKEENDRLVTKARRNVINSNVAGGRPQSNFFIVSESGSIVKSDGRTGHKVFVSKDEAKATLDVFAKEMSFHGVSKGESNKIFGRWS